jgi:hypothetical protein
VGKLASQTSENLFVVSCRTLSVFERIQRGTIRRTERGTIRR